MFRLFISIVLICISISASAFFTSYPTGTVTTDRFTLVWDEPNEPAVLKFWVDEFKNQSTTATRVASSGSSVEIVGRGDGTYKYELWKREEYERRGEIFQRNVLIDTKSVTVSVIVDPPTKPDSPAINYTGQYDVRLSYVEGATKYIVEEKKNSGNWAQIAYENQIPAGTKLDVERRDLTAGTYYYQAKVCKGSKCSGWSEISNTRVVFKPVSAPSFTSSVEQSSYFSKTDLLVKWNTVDSATKYKLEEYVSPNWVTRVDENIATKKFDQRQPGSYKFKISAGNVAGYGPTKEITFKIVQKSNISAPVTARGPFTLSFYGPGNYTNVRQGNSLILEKISGNTKEITAPDGTHIYTAQRCFHNGELPDSCDEYGLPTTVEVLNKPGVPSSISVPNFSGKADIELTWGSATGTVHKYDVDYQKNNDGKWLAAYDGTNLRTGFNLSIGSYKFRVRACNTLRGVEVCSNEKVSPSITASKPNSTSITLDATTVLDNFLVAWDPVPNTLGYILEEDIDGKGFEPVLDQNIVSVRRDNRENKKYSYIVSACNDLGCSPASNIRSITVAIKPGSPGYINPPTNESLDATWGDSTGEFTFYNLDYYFNGDWYNAYEGENTNTPLDIGEGTYIFRVQGCQTTHQFTSCSDWTTSSNTHLAKPTTSPVIDLHEEDTDGQYTVSWNPITYANDYVLEQKVNAQAWIQQDGIVGTSKAYPNQSNNSYYYQVKACNAIGCSEFSSVAFVNVAITPGKPLLDTLSNEFGRKNLELKWTPVTGRVTRYLLEKETNNDW